MPPGTKRELTERQAAVMERIDRRVPIKVIAQELGVSETRINQHIRALKDIYGAGNLRDLVDLYRADSAEYSPEPPLEEKRENEGVAAAVVRKLANPLDGIVDSIYSQFAQSSR